MSPNLLAVAEVNGIGASGSHLGHLAARGHGRCGRETDLAQVDRATNPRAPTSKVRTCTVQGRFSPRKASAVSA